MLEFVKSGISNINKKTSTETFNNHRFPKGHTLHHHFEKNDLKIFENLPFDLEKIQNKFLCVRFEQYCVKISALFHYFEKMTLKFPKIAPKKVKK